MRKIIQGLSSRWRNQYYRWQGLKLQGYVLLRAIEIPRNHHEIKLETSCALDRGVVLLCSGDPQPEPKICIGFGTYINRHTFIDASQSITIGRQCAIGPFCYITDHDHQADGLAPLLDQPLVSKPTKIGDRVWLGANVTVLKGVTIGARAVIGAGSVVTKDIPAGATAVGVPAQVIRQSVQTMSAVVSAVNP